jgi:hypothetical protein
MHLTCSAESLAATAHLLLGTVCGMLETTHGLVTSCLVHHEEGEKTVNTEHFGSRVDMACGLSMDRGWTLTVSK